MIGRSKQAAPKFDMGRFNLRKLNALEVIKHFHIEIANKFADLEKLSDSEGINRAQENIKENFKISAKENLSLYELKQETPWFDE